MSISERVPGKVYRFRCMHKGCSYDKTYYGTKRQAEKAHEKWLRSVKNGEIQENEHSGYTITKAYENYRASKDLEANTIVTYNQAMKRFDDRFLSLDVTDIDKQIANSSITEIKKTHTDICAYQNYVFAKALFNYLIDIGTVETNPFSFKMKKPKTKLSNKDEVISIDNINIFIEGLDDIKRPLYKVMFLLSIGCGPRKSEFLGLKKEDIDTVNHTINISKQYKNTFDASGKIVTGLGLTKNVSSVRINNIPEFVRESLYPYLDTIPSGGWVFPGRSGDKPISKQAVSYMLNKVCEDTGIKRITPHDLRRIHATISYYAGNSLMSISSALGHSKLEMTLHYVRKLSAIDDRSTQNIDSFLKNEKEKQENK